jgi:hypothetical protein
MDHSSIVSKTLRGSWRDVAPPLTLTKHELSQVRSFLLRSGSASLAARALRNSALRSCGSAQELRQAHRLHVLQSILHERRLQKVCSLFQSRGIEPLLIKGWAIARLYPEPGLRPYGDLDFAVHPSEFSTASNILDDPQAIGNTVDLHKGLRSLDSTAFEDIYSRSQLVKVGQVTVRVPSWEDHLRILCVHLLGHGVWRPLWLCDIAMMIETRPPAFDWTVCLGQNKRRADWVACAVGLAHHFLGVDIDDLPIAPRAKQLPRWLVRSVRHQWNTPLHRHVSQQSPLANCIPTGGGLLAAILSRWPNPIEATISVEGPFNSAPRLPFQFASILLRGSQVLRGLTTQFRSQTTA